MFWLEVAGAIVGLIYLWLEYRASVWLWAANVVMPAIYIFIYAQSGFYADMGINIYYLVASIYGWAMWRYHKDKEQRELPIAHTPRKAIAPLALVGVVSWGAILFVLLRWTDSTVPYRSNSGSSSLRTIIADRFRAGGMTGLPLTQPPPQAARP